MIARARLLVRVRCADCGVVVAEVEDDPDNPGLWHRRARLVRRQFWAVTTWAEATCPQHGPRNPRGWDAAVARARRVGRVVTVRVGPPG